MSRLSIRIRKKTSLLPCQKMLYRRSYCNFTHCLFHTTWLAKAVLLATPFLGRFLPHSLPPWHENDYLSSLPLSTRDLSNMQSETGKKVFFPASFWTNEATLASWKTAISYLWSVRIIQPEPYRESSLTPSRGDEDIFLKGKEPIKIEKRIIEQNYIDSLLFHIRCLLLCRYNAYRI